MKTNPFSKRNVLLSLLVVAMFILNAQLVASSASSSSSTSIKVGKSPWGIAFDSSNNLL